MTATPFTSGTALVAAIIKLRQIKCQVKGNHAILGNCRNCGTMTQADWNHRATKVQARHRYWCTLEDVNCHHETPHKHGVDCDYTCKCKGE